MRLSRRAVRLGIAVLALLLFAMGTTARAAPTAATANVTIAGFAFTPSTVTIGVGGSVTWTNTDGAPHSALRTGSGAFDTAILTQGQTATVTFDTAGTFSYVCGVHGASMTGTVVVAGVATATPLPPTPAPTPAPTAAPTAAPTVAPTIAPTAAPTVAPTIAPTAAPTVAPTIAPSAAPTSAPAAAASATTVPGSDYYEDPTYGSPPPSPVATTIATTPAPTVAAAEPSASAAVAGVAAGDGGPAPLLVAGGALLVLAVAGALWRLRRT